MSTELRRSTGSMPGVSAEEVDRVRRIEKVALELLAGCKWFLKQMEDGFIVRDITRDAQEDWAMRMVSFVSELQIIQRSVAKAEGR